MAELQLNHVNIPARDPEGLVRWYAETFGLRAEGNKAQMAKVTTGISDDTYTEIKSGIQAGDEVISGSYSAISRKLKEGAKVALDKEGMK